MSKTMPFCKWLLTQKDRSDAIGWFAEQVSKRSRLTPSFASDVSELDAAIKGLSGSLKRPMMAAFKTALKEWGDVDEPSVDILGDDVVMSVVSTVGRLRKSIERNMESGVVEEEETIVVNRFRGPIAHTGIEGSIHVNLGDFENAKVRVWVSSPCYPEELGDMADCLSQWVGGKLVKELSTIIDIKGGSVEGKEILEVNNGDSFISKSGEPSETVKRIYSGDGSVMPDEPDENEEADIQYESSGSDTDPLF